MGTSAASHRRVALAAARLVLARLQVTRALDRYSLPEVLRSLAPVPVGWDIPAPEAAVAVRVAESLCRRFGLPNTCLYRAISRWVLLRWLGRPAQFVMAIDAECGGDYAHAWVDGAGEAFLEHVRPRHVVVYRYPSNE